MTKCVPGVERDRFACFVFCEVDEVTHLKSYEGLEGVLVVVEVVFDVGEGAVGQIRWMSCSVRLGRMK